MLCKSVFCAKWSTAGNVFAGGCDGTHYVSPGCYLGKPAVPRPGALKGLRCSFRLELDGDRLRRSPSFGAGVINGAPPCHGDAHTPFAVNLGLAEESELGIRFG